jgi:hypothetical protein
MPEGKQLTKDFSGKTPAQIASIMKAEAGGVKRNAEERIWPQIFLARDNEDKLTHTVWVEVITHLAEGTEDPPVASVEPFSSGAPLPEGGHTPQLTLS